ncbi:hypothetical protein PtB15_14B253 [Puccinia triticina]|nr:hypothetical protein PtB15_14B253 [Puccinia triticina]
MTSPQLNLALPSQDLSATVTPGITQATEFVTLDYLVTDPFGMDATGANDSATPDSSVLAVSTLRLAADTLGHFAVNALVLFQPYLPHFLRKG